MIDHPMRGDNRWPLLLLAVAVTATLTTVAWTSMTMVVPTYDTPLYETLGHNLAAGKGFIARERIAVAELIRPGTVQTTTPNKEVPSAIRAPGYPFFLAIFYRLGLGTASIIVVQVLLFILSAVITTAGVRAVTGSEATAVVAGLIVATHLPTIFFAHVIMSDELFLPMIAGGFFLLWSAGERGRWRDVAGAAVLFAFAPLVRPIAMFLPFLCGAYLLMKKRIAMAVLIVLVAIIPSALWTARNMRVQHVPMLDGVSSENILFFHAAEVLIVQGRPVRYALLAMHENSDFYYRLIHSRPGLWDKVRVEMRRDGIDPQRSTYLQRCVYYRRIGLRIIREHPFDHLLLTINGVVHLFAEQYWLLWCFRHDYREARTLFLPVSIVMFASAVYGVPRLWRKDRAFTLLALAFIAYFVILSAEPATDPRMTIPYVPMYAALSAAGIVRAYGRERASRLGNIGPSKMKPV
jgi:hypothetical protein